MLRRLGARRNTTFLEWTGTGTRSSVLAMLSQGARTPEELEALFEDAFVTRDAEALSGMFAEGAVLTVGEGPYARGAGAIGRLVTALWEGGRTYVAEPRRVVQARETALVLADGAISVVRRGSDGAWRYTVVLLSRDPNHPDGGKVMTPRNQTQALEPAAVRKNEGEARWWFGCLAEIKATVADTGGQMSIVETTWGPGAEAPLHVHHRDDEGFWVLDGDVTFEVGGTTIAASAGDYAFGPRDIPHRFTVGDTGCRMLFLLVPGGIEDLILATSEPAPSRTVPPPPENEPTPEEMARLKATIKEFGYELLI